MHTYAVEFANGTVETGVSDDVKRSLGLAMITASRNSTVCIGAVVALGDTAIHPAPSDLNAAARSLTDAGLSPCVLIAVGNSFLKVTAPPVAGPARSRNRDLEGRINSVLCGKDVTLGVIANKCRGFSAEDVMGKISEMVESGAVLCTKTLHAKNKMEVRSYRLASKGSS